MEVKVRAVVVDAGRLLVSREWRHGQEHLALPGGRVKRWETLEEALVREVEEETGVTVTPLRLLYVAESTKPYRLHDVNLIFLAEARAGLNGTSQLLLDLGAEPSLPFRPPILKLIAEDAARGWPRPPRWLGNLWDDPPGPVGAA
jgi:ADP-ribose pyrophosphatase YjhB (NUDIX family)